MGILPPKGLLLYGPPGTGKTLLARAVATEAHSHFLSISVADLVQGEMGESEKILKNVFKMARSFRPCIVFFDEFQAMFRSRQQTGQLSSQLSSQLLVEMDELEQGEVFVLAATNAPQCVDPAMLRPGRFDRALLVGLPDEGGREEILHSLRRRMPWESSVSVSSLVYATDTFTGADLHRLCRQAAMIAIEQQQECISEAHFRRALELVQPSTTKDMIEFYHRWRKD